MAAIALAGASLVLQFSSGHVALAANATLPAGDLGPADALLLNDAKPAKGQAAGPVKVSAEGGRLGWDSQPTSRAWSIAAINVDKTMKAILSGAAYADKRKELDDDAKKQDGEFNKRYEELRKKYGNLEPTSPDALKAQQELTALRDEYTRWREGSVRNSEALAAQQIEKAYRELTSAVDIVSDRMHVDIVCRFMPTGEPFNASTLLEAREQVVGRTLLRYPEAIDITADVMKELGVKE